MIIGAGAVLVVVVLLVLYGQGLLGPGAGKPDDAKASDGASTAPGKEAAADPGGAPKAAETPSSEGAGDGPAPDSEESVEQH